MCLSSKSILSELKIFTALSEWKHWNKIWIFYLPIDYNIIHIGKRNMVYFSIFIKPNIFYLSIELIVFDKII